MTIGIWTGRRIFTLKVFLPLAIISISLCILSDYVVENLVPALEQFFLVGAQERPRFAKPLLPTWLRPDTAKDKADSKRHSV
jgi:hypothetical protein